MHASQESVSAATGSTILDTCFGDGWRFMDHWSRWRATAGRPAMLHYVGLLTPAQAVALVGALGYPSRPIECATSHPPFNLAQELAAQCYALEPGFQRILLDRAQVSLTLCIGDPVALLDQLRMQATHIWAAHNNWSWDRWRFKSLARLCAKGAHLALPAGVQTQLQDLSAAGFVPVLPSGADAAFEARFAPRWQLRDARHASAPPSDAPRRCAVIGAGIAGAAVADALARRGWSVRVYDQAEHPAAGASGLPAGLVVPHFSQDDCSRSRLSRAGVRLMLDHAQRLLHSGQDWARCGALELQLDVPAALPPHDNDWSAAASTEQLQQDWALGVTQPQASLWHTQAGWIKPAQLVAAWMAHPDIEFKPLSPVHTLRQDSSHNDGRWNLCDAQGDSLGRADQVVFANARGCIALIQSMAQDAGPSLQLVDDLLEKLQAMQILHGTLSCGVSQDTDAFPAFAVNGNGSFLSGIPQGDERHWYAGSTFETDVLRAIDVVAAHASNFDKLSALLPQVAQTLAPQFASGKAEGWAATRCVSHDRMPLVGPVEDSATPSLWICTGMGARGLSFSALCAELLAAQIANEPLPLSTAMAKGLHSQRLRRSTRMAEASHVDTGPDSAQVIA